MSLEWVEDMLGLTTWHGHVCEGQLDSVRELFGYETRLLRGLRRNKAMKDMEEAIRDAGARVGISLLTDLSQNLARVQTTQCAEAASSASSSEDEDGDGVSASLDAFTDDVDYDDLRDHEAFAGQDLADARAPSSIAISDYTTEDEATEVFAPLTVNLDVSVSLAARSIVEARLGGGTGLEATELEPANPSMYYFAAYLTPAARKSWCVVDVLGGAEAMLICENTVLWVDGCGAMGQGAGARVADMNVQGPVTGGHRQRFPLWYLALHATIVSPVARSGEPRSRADTQPGSLNSGGKAAAASSSSALGCVEVGGRFGAEAATLLRLLARQRAASVARGSGADPPTCPALPNETCTGRTKTSGAAVGHYLLLLEDEEGSEKRYADWCRERWHDSMRRTYALTSKPWPTYAYLDDACILAPPHRALQLYHSLALGNAASPVCIVTVDPGLRTRCQALGIDLRPAAPPSHQTAHTTVRDYATRTFSAADAAEPAEPHNLRAVCCRRLAGPALGFAELPDASMHWAPLPHRNDVGIASWTPQWLCMRCQNVLPVACVQTPGPPPPCLRCSAPMLWEVNLASHVERWVCSCCPFAHPVRPFALGPEPPLPASQAVPAPEPALPQTVVQYVDAVPPPLPLIAGTNSEVYVLILRAWWQRTVEALLARPFLPVQELAQAGNAMRKSPHSRMLCGRPCAADAPADTIQSGNAALRRVAAAEEGLRVGLASLDGIDLEATLSS
ncbi:unnamed protein product [Symbiodinium natans]|uniref:Uncharacterized protein n=1 Tax=Symbiodinium natans TaxID=878477 RepID=A0A812GFH4_9DINO|nr:unnamed protein product [Symbiodinium natans]